MIRKPREELNEGCVVSTVKQCFYGAELVGDLIQIKRAIIKEQYSDFSKISNSISFTHN